MFIVSAIALLYPLLSLLVLNSLTLHVFVMSCISLGRGGGGGAHFLHSEGTTRLAAINLATVSAMMTCHISIGKNLSLCRHCVHPLIPFLFVLHCYTELCQQAENKIKLMSNYLLRSLIAMPIKDLREFNSVLCCLTNQLPGSWTLRGFHTQISIPVKPHTCEYSTEQREVNISSLCSYHLTGLICIKLK